MRQAIEAISQCSSEPNMTGYALANSTNLTTFDFISQHPARAKSFAVAMSTTSTASLNALANSFPWQDLPSESQIVDVGGSTGHVSIHLARHFTHLHFLVQDLAPTIHSAPALPIDVTTRVTLTEHDMFTPQPVTGAEVYLFRFVMHDWPDSYCVRILRQLVPALKRGAKVVIQDHLLPEPGTLSLLQEMQIRSMDAIMLSLFNSRERDEADWLELFAEADERFVECEVSRVKENAATGIIVATWAGTGLGLGGITGEA
jgi:hypothetical protein